MQKLNQSRPFGRITPPYPVPGTGRLAAYEQDGRFYDTHGALISTEPPRAAPAPAAAVVAPPVTEAAPAAVEAVTADTAPVAPPVAPPAPEAQIGPAELLAGASSMGWAKFRGEAQRILGAACPPSKSGIVAALEAMVSGNTTVAQPPSTGPVNPDSPVIDGVDLAAWARGQKDYLFGDIQKALRKGYAKVVSERRDAVDFLVDEKVIAAAEARQDV